MDRVVCACERLSGLVCRRSYRHSYLHTLHIHIDVSAHHPGVERIHQLGPSVQHITPLCKPTSSPSPSYRSSSIAVAFDLRQPRDRTLHYTVHCGSSRHYSDQPQDQLSPTTEPHRAHHARTRTRIRTRNKHDKVKISFT